VPPKGIPRPRIGFTRSSPSKKCSRRKVTSRPRAPRRKGDRFLDAGEFRSLFVVPQTVATLPLRLPTQRHTAPRSSASASSSASSSHRLRRVGRAESGHLECLKGSSARRANSSSSFGVEPEKPRLRLFEAQPVRIRGCAPCQGRKRDTAGPCAPSRRVRVVYQSSWRHKKPPRPSVGGQPPSAARATSGDLPGSLDAMPRLLLICVKAMASTRRAYVSAPKSSLTPSAARTARLLSPCYPDERGGSSICFLLTNPGAG